MCNDSFDTYIQNKEIDDMHLLITTSRIFNGIEYLYKNHLLHRDIKPSSILIDHDNLAYISDFETIRTEDLTDGEFENDIGSLLYSSPEQDNGENISYPTDIYSFGLVIYFLFEKKHMYKSFDDKHRNVIQKMNKGSSNIQQIYENCVKYNPNDRMTHEQIKTILNKEFQNISIFKNSFINEKYEINIDNIIDYIYEMILNQETNESLSFYLERIQEFRYLSLIEKHTNESFNQLSQGLCYYYGHNKEQNYKESKKCLELSLQINNIAFLNSFEITEQFKQEYSEFIEYNSKIVKKINSYCYFYLGNHYFHGFGVEEDYQKGIEFYKKSSELNNYQANIKLSYIYEAGHGVEQNISQSKEYYERSLETKE